MLTLLSIPRLSISAEDEGAKSVDAAWEKAMKAGDVDALVACYAPDAVVWFPGHREAKGHEAIRAVYQSLLADNNVTDVKMTNTHYDTVGDKSVGWGSFSITLTPKSGAAPSTMTGRFTEFCEKRDGRWVYVVDHASEEPPAEK